MLKHCFSALLFGLALSAAGCGAPDESALAETDEQIELFAAPALMSPPSGRATRHPIVLTHGFDASPTNRWGFNGVSQALRQDGHTVIVATVPPYDSPAVRAQYLARYVDQALATGRTGKVNIIAHSMGGLDSRELISVLRYGDRVASLTTISSPTAEPASPTWPCASSRARPTTRSTRSRRPGAARTAPWPRTATCVTR